VAKARVATARVRLKVFIVSLSIRSV